ncbi:hypothetical protein KDM41_01875 [bacterium]|nr:hypothetical protein [bacterium]
MKRINLVLVLLVTVFVVGGAVSAPMAKADVADSISVPDSDVKSGDLDGTLNGPDGDPDGMGTGNGLTDDDDLLIRASNGLDGVAETETLLYVLSLIKLLAI